LRPCADDTAVVQRVAQRLGATAHAVVLGLTPETIGCDWPEEVTLTAVDHSLKMIQDLWPPVKRPVHSTAIRADWCAMPFETGAIDMVAGDGCYVLPGFPEGYAMLTREVCRVLRPGGRFVIRVFLRPEHPDSVADIARAVALGHVGSVHSLKLRLLAAVHGASGEGSLLDDVWQAWRTMPALPDSLPGARGWTIEEIAGIESYRGMDTRYYLPTLAEFRQSVGARFDEVEFARGRHELAERCPTIILTRRT